MDTRGCVAAIALGAQGAQMGSRFVAAGECISHQKYKEAIVAAKARAAMTDGDLESGIVYTGVGSGLISEILTVHQVFEDLEQGTQTLARNLS